MQLILNTHLWMSLIILTTLEVILSGDNIVFIVSATTRLPTHQQAMARRWGLIVAMITRLAFLGLIFHASKLSTPLFHLGSHEVSVRHLVLFFGGLFLIINPWVELYETRKIADKKQKKQYAKLFYVLGQIALVDIIFSIDSVITAIGVSDHYGVMASAIIIATLFMLLASNWLAQLLQTSPKLKVLALCFLVLIGVVLMLRGLGFDISSAYIYAPFAFAVFTNMMLGYTKV